MRYRHVWTGLEVTPPLPDEGLRIGADDAVEYLVGPALFDPQVNGFEGVDFQDPTLDADRLGDAVAAIRGAGCSHFLLTLVTQSLDRMEAQLARVAACLDERPTLADAILGIHVEGPFLSATAGFHGAHSPQHLRDPDWAIVEAFQQASGGRIRMLTLAPERPGALEVVRRATDEGIWVAVGHTDASMSELRDAVQAGARLATHLGNGCPERMHRHDNIIQRILGVPELTATVIPDLLHVPPPALGNLLRCLGPDRLALTTDSMSAADASRGRHRLGELEMDVGDDGVVRLPGTGQFAGSSLRMVDGLVNAVRAGGISVESAWRAATTLRDRMFPGVAAPPLLLPADRFAGDASQPGLAR